MLGDGCDVGNDDAKVKEAASRLIGASSDILLATIHSFAPEFTVHANIICS